MTTTAHANSPVRSCRTCVHCVPDNLRPRFDHCSRFVGYCSVETKFDFACGRDLKEWRPIPPPKPRRSLRQWFVDTFTA